jgi:uncharacterized Zn-binding protein involved in type VI secretion
VNRFGFRKRALPLLGFAIGALIFNHQFGNAHESPPSSSAQHSGRGEHRQAHDHGTIELSGESVIPTVNLTVHPDARQGWNLEVQVTNFRFAPEQVNQSSLPTEGHAHLYINGEKITRLYGNWYYLESLPSGQHEITVSLNANGHEALTVNGQPIEAVAEIDVP